MIALVVSRADRASEHIGEQVLALADWTERVDENRPEGAGGGTYHRRLGFELRTFDDLHLHLSDAAEAFDDPSLLLFLSRHSGETGPLLSAHFTGNFGPAEYGGADGDLARACPEAQKAVVAALADHAPDGYDVGIECTHHGPSRVGCPSMFVELGSGPDEWDDPDGARAVARAVLALADVVPDRHDGDRTRHVVGFGGGHYAPRFERIVRETDWAVGHIGADWPLEAMGHPETRRDVIRAAFEASAADLAVVDGDRPALVSVVAEAGFRVVSETFLRTTAAVPRSLVSRVEGALGSVDDGLRFGTHARVGLAGGDDTPDAERAPDFAVVDLPDDLLDAALGIDAAAVRDAVADHSVGYRTAESGQRPTERAALPVRDDVADGETDALDTDTDSASDAGTGTHDTGPDADAVATSDASGDSDVVAAYDRLVAGLCAVLRERYSEVSREGDVVVARESAFDPDAAADLGVEPGPAFGRLASGDAVEVDGRWVDPADVHRDRIVRFQV
ncbi:D-aminoacyl-tRNA deacylase [Salinigranum salinum]|uniref:D-aminoacyl-tRNA deacylase n=1 Tax=Salinigranum salinum TaxID=1364937 RepID=UPI001260B689|nr:D-aminoacyl-tRNA deacylase [Salinigranum salinum]